MMASTSSMSNFMAQKKAHMKVEFGKFEWNFRMLILTSLLPLGSSTKSSTPMSMNCQALYAWMLSTSHGVQCSLLLYPNPSDPLNSDAASLMMKDKAQYEAKVKEYCERFAKKQHTENSDESGRQSKR